MRTLGNNYIGHDNTAIGIDALSSNNGAYNVALGSSALMNGHTGNNNTAIGYKALMKSDNAGGENTAVGSEALSESVLGHRNTAVGNIALSSITNGDANVAVGASALWRLENGHQNVAVGSNALGRQESGDRNTAIGDEASVSSGAVLTNATAIGYAAVVNASNKVRIGNDAITVIEGRVPFSFTSDKNQKEHFRPVDGEEVLKKIGGLSLASWNYIGQEAKQFRHYGPVAQEFFAAFGHDEVGTIGTSTTINSGDMDGILMIAVQALEKRTAELQDEKAKREMLEARLEALERRAFQE